MASSKKLILDARSFQEFCTTDFGFVSRNDKAVCALFCQSVVCRTSNIKRHFETKHKKFFKDNAETIEYVTRYKKQSGIFKKVICSTNRTIEGSYKVAEGIATHEKPFTDGLIVKEAFVICAEVLFDDLLNKCRLISRIKDTLVSPRTVERRITDMATDETEQQNCCVKSSECFQRAP